MSLSRGTCMFILLPLISDSERNPRSTQLIKFQARDSVLLDLYTKEDSHDNKSLAAYRKGDFKLISGSYKDPNWYYEPTEDRVKTSDSGFRSRIIGSR